MKLQRVIVLPALLAAGVLASACGSSLSSASHSAPPAAQSAAKVVPAMKAAVQSATSLRMTGTGQDGSQKITFDMTFSGSSDMSGTFTENGTTLTILVVSGKTYLKMNQDFLKLAKLPTSLCARVCGKYVELPAAESGQITSAVSLSALTKNAFGSIPSSVSKDTTDYFVPGTFRGQPVLTAHDQGYTIDVARTGTPYPVLISDPSGNNIVFSEWNAVPPMTPPPASQVVSLSSL